MFVFAGARGPHIFTDWKKSVKKSVFLTPEGDRSLSEQFNTWKDVVIPGMEFHEQLWSGSLRGKAGPERNIFAFFRGTICGAACISPRGSQAETAQVGHGRATS